MKTIGLIGGMSWESSVEYYKLVNTLVKEARGGLHSAKCILYSVDFAEIEQCQREDRWEDAGRILVEAAQALQRAGADCLLLCTNTMHRLAAEIRGSVEIPFLHIAHAAADEIRAKGCGRIGLLGTVYTMEGDFYRSELEERGIGVLIPDEEDRQTVNAVIYDELCRGIILPESREKFVSVIRRLQARGAEGVVLGCTEIGLLLRQDDSPLPLFDTAYLHAKKAVAEALQG
ncbi:aspartate/glutamate racemase family protein [Paenibacillus mucilaginosus]|uniref:YgeA n=2 Tax=Paenibacillus mucilaginosus TaxID=61624 RepID=H6NHP8_9BACL|nr:aspartate/glutamate racemase family protein [Paenibacillus mucilaginosus]AEI41072.1 YgeA [Paenibacillus mucilaginosus KNP414]AFC29645.1 YgeA [Paenibacillus mucilaginosus 3016]MCG7211485.1 aspartate/glutamate racemase family protein [Paenibacillus mucilaginosus]WDM30140.1 aspartate/glutamate racemase family protein [Paenibacillus mucilaginosus]WFA18327.1 aspartate/glutamate racemase family protein [Paenibacillus mucilaginosus]